MTELKFTILELARSTLAIDTGNLLKLYGSFNLPTFIELIRLLT